MSAQEQKKNKQHKEVNFNKYVSVINLIYIYSNIYHLLSFPFKGSGIMFVTIIIFVVHEIGIIMLDMLLLSSLINYFSKQYEHNTTARTENGKSVCSLQVRVLLCNW